MEVYIKKPVSEPPEKDGVYYVLTLHGELTKRNYQTPVWEYTKDPDRHDRNVTHYLVPIEANVLTDDELEAVKKKARDEVWNEPLY